MIHASSVSVPREHRRAKTDRLDTGLLKRAFLGWLRGYRARTADARSGTRKTMIVALARKLLIALWRLTTTGEVPQCVVFPQA